jgi:hypothetical protein
VVVALTVVENKAFKRFVCMAAVVAGWIPKVFILGTNDSDDGITDKIATTAAVDRNIMMKVYQTSFFEYYDKKYRNEILCFL